MPPEHKASESCGHTLDQRLEALILDLLAQRARAATICPSDAARAVGGKVVDPAAAKGPIRIRLP